MSADIKVEEVEKERFSEVQKEEMRTVVDENSKDGFS